MLTARRWCAVSHFTRAYLLHRFKRRYYTAIPIRQMALLLSSSDAQDWVPHLKDSMTDVEVRVWPDAGNLDAIEFACVWELPDDVLHKCRNLKVIFSLGAGVDHLLEPGLVPSHIPLVRVVDDLLSQRMVEHVVHSVLAVHRRQFEFAEQQQRRVWRPLHTPLASERRVGILGLGALGSACASALARIGFDVAGWSRTQKHIDNVQSFHGDDQLIPLVQRTDILICLLPLTPQTENMIDGAMLASLPKGASLINPGRGRHVVEHDLLAALDSGHLSYALLDTFRIEPLPQSHPFWSHPRVIVTPHIASTTDPRSVAPSIAENIRRYRSNQPLLNVVDRSQGY